MAKRKHQLTTAAVKSRLAAVAGAGLSRLKERDPKERRCALDDCGRAFRPSRHWQRFCSTRCRYRSWDTENPRVRIKAAGRR